MAGNELDEDELDDELNALEEQFVSAISNNYFRVSVLVVNIEWYILVGSHSVMK